VIANIFRRACFAFNTDQMPQIKIASFNVNSISARWPALLEWLRNSNPDVVLLQELKCAEANFPFASLSDMGYNAVVSGQKTYNGVAIISKFKIEDVLKALPQFNEEFDEQARYVEAVISVASQILRVASIYVPNGGGNLPPDEKLENSQKFRYKLRFFDRLKYHLAKLVTYDEMQIFGGDFNVAAEEIDVFAPKSFDGNILFHPLERQKFRELLNLGLIDSYRALHQQQQSFSWWDYRGGSWQYNKGLRIDYLLASAKAADKISAATIEDKNVRDRQKASDHCPVTVTMAIS
jgi:exodeoxyribonuclease-3